MRWMRGEAILALLLAVGMSQPARANTANVAPAKAVEPADDAPYDPAGRRDPFRPPRAAASPVSGAPRTPLERYELGQLKLVAVIYDTGQPRAVVEDDEGLGYIVKVGTHIGANGGQVESIQRGRLVVREDNVDFYGEHHPVDVPLELKTSEKRSGSGERGMR